MVLASVVGLLVVASGIEGAPLEIRGTTPIVAVRVDDANDSRLIVVAGEKYTGAPTPCTKHTEVRLTEQDAAHVRVAAFRYEPASRPEKGICPRIGLPPNEVTVDLAAPLAGRDVYTNDGDTPVDV